MEHSYIPVNPNASKQACALLDYLYEIRGNHILSGQHNYDSQLRLSTQKTEEITGSSPVIWGGDFLGCKHRKKMVDEAIRQHVKGSIITLMYHQVKPFNADELGFHRSVRGRVSGGVKYSSSICSGTAIQRGWCQDVSPILTARILLLDAQLIDSSNVVQVAATYPTRSAIAMG